MTTTAIDQRVDPGMLIAGSGRAITCSGAAAGILTARGRKPQAQTFIARLASTQVACAIRTKGPEPVHAFA
jgi:hypothetical protein